jgi:osmotically-inducible protein OsmY
MEASCRETKIQDGEASSCGRNTVVAVRERLRSSAYIELRGITWTIENRVLCLRGRVSSYYVRQLAQACVRGLEGVEAIDNQLEVMDHRRRLRERLSYT